MLPCLLAVACGAQRHQERGFPDGETDGGGAAPLHLEGVLRDEHDRPVADTRVLACMANQCLYGASGDDGRFAFTIESRADLVIKTEPDPLAMPRRGAAMVPVQPGQLSEIDVGNVYVPDLPEGQALASVNAPQTIRVGDGLELTLQRSVLVPPLGVALFDVAARRLKPSAVPVYPVLGEHERVVAVYALHPFASRSAIPIAVRAPSDLAPNTRVTFRTISDLDGTFSDPVPGVATGAFVTTDPGVGITELTHLVVAADGEERKH